MQIIQGKDIKPGMLVRSRLGIRFIVRDARDGWWSVHQARKDWLRDLRFYGWSGDLEPTSEWELHGWADRPQSTIN